MKTFSLRLSLALALIVVAFVATSQRPPTASGTPVSSHNVALVPNANGAYSGAGTLPALAGYTFTDLPVSSVDAAHLAQFDTVVLYQICNIASVLSSSQEADLVSWLSGGGKLIIYDSDACGIVGGGPTPDYSWFPYAFSTDNPGQTGQHTGQLDIVENNTLSSANTSSPYYIDTADLVNNTDAVGDSNVMLTKDSHWCGSMESTNVDGKKGWTRTYAAYGKGLIIYDGLDTDYIGSNINLQKLWQFELEQQWNPTNLPCGTSVTHNVVIFVGGLGSYGDLAWDTQAKLSRDATSGFANDFIVFSYSAAWDQLNYAGYACTDKDGHTVQGYACGWAQADIRQRPVYSADDTRRGRETSTAPLSVDRHADALEWLIAELKGEANSKGWNLSVSLVGYSLGGVVALHWAAHHPTQDVVRAIVPIDSPIGGVNSHCDDLVVQWFCNDLGDIALELAEGEHVTNTNRDYVSSPTRATAVVPVENSRDKVVNGTGALCRSTLHPQDWGLHLGRGGVAYPSVPGRYLDLGQENPNCIKNWPNQNEKDSIIHTHGFVLADHNECAVKASIRYAVINGRAGGSCQSVFLTPGQTVQTSAVLSVGTSSVEFVATYGSVVDMSLADPSGSLIGPDTPLPNVYHEKGSGFERYIVADPLPGTWTIVLFGADLPSGGEDIGMDVWTQGASNNPPVADAGPDFVIAAESGGAASVQLDGSASSDPDGDPLTYMWSWNSGTNTASGVMPTLQLPLGTTEVTLVVNDGELDSPPAEVTIQVVPSDTTAPVSSVTPPIRRFAPVPMPLAFQAVDPAGPGGEEPSGVAYVELWYRYGRGWRSSGAWSQYGDHSTSSPISFTPPRGSGVYDLYTIAVDNAGNREAPPGVPDATYLCVVGFGRGICLALPPLLRK